MSEHVAYSAAEHPAPHRQRVGWAPLFYGLLAAPVVWAGNLMVTYGLVTHACFADGVPLPAPESGFRFVGSLTFAFYLVTLCVCASAGFVSFVNWRRVHGEAAGPVSHLVEAGEGRTRFLGIVGMAFSTLFFAATIFGLLVYATEPLCAY
jgi:hypothetical protein